jgi:hypothetical protein
MLVPCLSYSSNPEDGGDVFLRDVRCFQRAAQRYIPEDRTVHVSIINNLLTADASDLKFGNLSFRLVCLRLGIPSASHRHVFLTLRIACLFSHLAIPH